MTLLRQYDDWRTSWELAVAGSWAPGGLLLYDRAAGTGAFYSVDRGGGMSLLRQYDDWRTSWDLAVAGGWAPLPGPRSGRAGGLLLYDRAAGTGAFYAVNPAGGMTLLRQYDDWRTSWDLAVAGDWAPGGLLLYDRAAGTGAFYAVGGGITCSAVTSSDSNFMEWRLVEGLRTDAAFPGRDFTTSLSVNPPPVGWDQRNPIGTLTNAAKICTSAPIDFQYEAKAMADLAVTGRLSYETLAALSLRTPADVVARLVLDGANEDAAAKVVARAQQVAWAIRADPDWRATLRPQLGWIGVSGEDDAPHRPCNVASLPGPQFDIEVPGIPVVNGTLTVKTRIVIAESPWPTPTTTMEGTPPTFLPPDEIPAISPDSDYVFLYMAGDCSVAEEANDMIPALLTAAEEHGKRASVVAFDMIGWGYSARRAFDSAGNPVLFDQGAIFADGQPVFPLVHYPDNPPALQFVEDFVVALMQTLNRQPPYLDLARVIPVGGSLGGNLALRLGRRTDLKWLTAVCGWSPGSIWPSKATSPDAGTSAADGAAVGAAAGAAVGSTIPGVGTVIGAIVGAVVGAVGGGCWSLGRQILHRPMHDSYD